jgi:hypothetical protein
MVFLGVILLHEITALNMEFKKKNVLLVFLKVYIRSIFAGPEGIS